MKRKAMLIDIPRCENCGACEEACKEQNKLPENDDNGLSAYTYTKVREIKGHNVRRLCMHCNDPACLSVCPVNAFTKNPEGAVVYNANRCMGCRYCMVACPFGIPRFEWDRANPKISKCVFCFSRISKGGQPACAEACPVEATVFGDRDDVIKLARERIKAEPGKYIDHIYGLNEVGGTSVVYISSVPFGQLGFPTNVEPVPLPQLTWKILKQVPNVVTLGALMLGGIYWITRRREEVARFEEQQQKEQKERETR
ncbi:MAG: 4Fe-4S dicluster domain-containing protein [Deltaproteobacteria bacterium]|nr:4Fe-4S dicluster domain-containing protein [Deltaproteobacteria bacterium]MBW2308971.1 4Fe-4S dicluster domain-containing protein [Deltaproteobacteria bacterium]